MAGRPGLDQEVQALLTAYQALIPTADGAGGTGPGVAMERISFTVLPEAATDQVTLAANVFPSTTTSLLGAIGRAVLDALWPAGPRRRLKARSRENPTSTYGPNAGKHPQQTRNRILAVDIQIMDDGLASRRPRSTRRR